jgi:CheY-like chemotaxis protein
MRDAQSCPRRIAVLDDNPGDLRLLEIVLGRHMPRTEVVTAQGWLRAWELVRGEGAFRDTWPYGMVLVDLRIGGHDGLELVRHLRLHGEPPHMPIVVFSGSADPGDVERSYRAGANAFVPKPSSFDEHDAMFEAVAQFWCKVAALPPSVQRAPA